MKLSAETLNILKNYAAINQGIMFKKGKVLKTVSAHKNILSQAEIKEDIENDFGVYDLNSFLSVVSMHKDEPSFEFDDKHVLIVGNGGRSKIKYRFCEPTMIIVPPEKGISLGDPEIKFALSGSDFEWILRAAAVLTSPHVVVESDGVSPVKIVTCDIGNDGAHTDSLDICESTGRKYKIVFKTEHLSKLLPGTYDVAISSKGIAHFTNKNVPIQYWLTMETSSTFNK